MESSLIVVLMLLTFGSTRKEPFGLSSRSLTRETNAYLESSECECECECECDANFYSYLQMNCCRCMRCILWNYRPVYIARYVSSRLIVFSQLNWFFFYDKS
jgi:hypothetical protein